MVLKLDAKVLETICRYLEPKDLFGLMLCNKHTLKTVEKFDAIWLYVTASQSWRSSQAGLWAIRARNLQEIDENNIETHKQMLKLRTSCFNIQESAFLKWLTFAAIMLTVFQPLLCICKADLNPDLDMAIVLVPVSLCWLALLFSIIYSLYKVSQFYGCVQGLMIGKPQVQGHNFRLPS